jgi:hypothetical protein
MNFSTKEDRLDEFNYQQQITLINRAKPYFRKYGFETNSPRSGDYFSTENYYESLR